MSFSVIIGLAVFYWSYLLVRASMVQPECAVTCTSTNPKYVIRPKSLAMIITACAIATNCCISDVPSQWEGRNFDPPQLPHFSTNLNET